MNIASSFSIVWFRIYSAFLNTHFLRFSLDLLGLYAKNFVLGSTVLSAISNRLPVCGTITQVLKKTRSFHLRPITDNCQLSHVTLTKIEQTRVLPNFKNTPKRLYIACSCYLLKRNTKLAPLPGPSLFAQIAPFISDMKFALLCNPNP